VTIPVQTELVLSEQDRAVILHALRVAERLCNLTDLVMETLAQRAPHLLPEFSPDVKAAMGARAAVEAAIGRII